MKSMVVLAAVLAVSSAAVFPPGVLIGSSFIKNSGSSGGVRTGSSVPVRTAATASSAVKAVAVAVSRGSSPDATAEIVRYDNDFNPDGSYHYYYETSNGITGQENGTPKSLGSPAETPVVAEGSFAWTAPDGKPVAISYVADENGYQPQGEDLPTPPPVPAAIIRALKWIQEHPYTEPK